MKLVYFDDFKLGVLKDDRVVDVSAVVQDIPHISPQDIINGLIEGFGGYRAALDKAASGESGIPLDQVRLRPPLPRPGKTLCMAVNYMELGARKEPAPIDAFIKSPNAIIGPGDTMVLPDCDATIFHHEAELAVVIGKRGHRIKAEEAMDYVFGYVPFVDGSARGLRGMLQGKSWDTFAPMGPAVTTADEVPDPHNLQIRLWVSGELRQDVPTSDMGHKIPECIEYCSWIMTLEPGDIISTGTNHQGLGALQDGDLVEVEIEPLGRFSFNVRDELKRQWPRGIDREMADRMAGRVSA